MKQDTQFSFKNLLLAIVSFFFFLLDVALDMYAIYSFYQEEAYVSLGVLIFVLVGSSVVLQLFSWMWYTKDSQMFEGRVYNFAKNHSLIGILHVLQLGIFLRYASLVEISIVRFWERISFPQAAAKKQNHDLLTLRLFETFTENIPQLCLMVSTVFIKKELELFTALKIAGSFIAVTISTLMFHRGMCALHCNEHNMGWGSSVIYSLWSLLLILARVTALALFASVLPIFVVAHFLTLWMSFIFWVWREKTKFMDGPGGEWLYRATVGLIWYFSWLNVTRESAKPNSVIYHVVIIMDTGLLVGMWWWKMVCEGLMFIKPLIVVSAVVSFYLVGLAFEMVYYKWLHCTFEVDLPEPTEGRHRTEIIQAACLEERQPEIY
ncbi:XK-related protein 8-like [Chanos chanos]|uniref:XK-related protein n=1 Tax=Chanos chanos TaxID=29144 RepID=A0A6J2WIV9_CHACN|nr:XK-related protein 8-like [Chanos chanos]